MLITIGQALIIASFVAYMVYVVSMLQDIKDNQELILMRQEIRILSHIAMRHSPEGATYRAKLEAARIAIQNQR